MKAPSLVERAIVDWPAKIVCLVLALLLFLFYRMSTLDQRYFSVPLTVESNGNFAPASTYPKMVKIRLRGETNSIYPILESDVTASVDLARFDAEGEVRVPIRAHLSGTALGIDPLEVTVDPPEIKLRLEHRVSKKVPINPDFRGFPETGFELTGYTVNPSTADISGPRSTVAKIATVTTDSVDLSGRSANFSGTALLLNTNPLVELSGGERVEYNVAIEPTTYVRSFSDIPILLSGLDPRFEVVGELPSGTLRLRGTNSELSAYVLPFDILSVNCVNVSEAGVYSLPIQTASPDIFDVVESTPTEIQLTFREAAE